MEDVVSALLGKDPVPSRDSPYFISELSLKLLLVLS